jgi:hypothetical protein
LTYRDLKYNLYLRFKYAYLGLKQAGYWQAHRRGGFNRWQAPWFNLSAVDFAANLLSPSDEVLEYGSGNGTLWLAGRCGQVTAIETDAGFAAGFFDAPLPSNARIEMIDPPEADAYERAVAGAGDPDGLAALADNYASHPYFAPLAGPARYDLIVVDGRARVIGGILALRALKPGGFMIFDNYDRTRYAPVHGYYQAQGITVVPIKGIAPFNDIPMLTAFVFPDPSRLARIGIELRDY